MENLANDFDRALRVAGVESQALGYDTSIIIGMINNNGAVGAAKRLVLSGSFQNGFTQMVNQGRKDLTIEFIMLQEKFSPLFSKQELEAATWRLANV